MATCKWCGKKGLFVSVDRNGLCSSCGPAIMIEAKSRLKVIRESQEIINKSKKLDTVLSRIDTIIENGTALLKYEKAGINILDPLPSRLIKVAESSKEEAIIEFVNQEVDKFMTKAETSATPKSQITQASKALEKIADGRKMVQSPEVFCPIERKVKTFIHVTQLNIYLDAAKKAEFKGQNKKAIDQYQEAIYFIKNDDIDDAMQAKEIGQFESKIAELT